MWFYFQKKVNVRELVIAQAAATPSSAIRNDFPKYDFPQIASFRSFTQILRNCLQKQRLYYPYVGNVLSDDVFAKDSLDDVFRLGRYGGISD